VDLNPDFAAAWINLGVVYFRLGDLAKAQTRCERAVELAPAHGYAWSNLGAVYDALGDSYRAIAAYQKSIEIDSRQGPVHLNLGTAYLRQGRIDKAIEEFKLAAGLDPNSPIIRKRLAYALSKDKKYGAAIEQLQAALAMDPRDWEGRNSLAAIYMIYYLRHPDIDRLRRQALEEWHASLEVNPEQPQVRQQVAQWSQPLPASAPGASDKSADEVKKEVESLLKTAPKPPAGRNAPAAEKPMAPDRAEPPGTPGAAAPGRKTRGQASGDVGR